MTAEQNYRLLLEIDANRRFILQACRDNPELLARAESRVRQWFQLDRGEAADVPSLNAVAPTGEVQ